MHFQVPHFGRGIGMGMEICLSSGRERQSWLGRSVRYFAAGGKVLEDRFFLNIKTVKKFRFG
jgi:hypothetical protein